MADREPEKNEANWWRFSIDKERRGDRIKDDPDAKTREINRQTAGRRLLSYDAYLGLDRLLGSQFPSSLTPDERVFITTHQLFELVFKQTIFDLRVIADTFSALLGHGRKEFAALAELNGEGGPAAKDFWTPALTAAARVRHGFRRVLPPVMAYLAAEETFNNREFTAGFRENLTPASGFQSARFRLIQRSLGKSPLLAIRLFPSDTYLREYLGMTEPEIMRMNLVPGKAGLVSVTDPLILQESSSVASPPASSPLFPVTILDDLAHRVLMEVAVTTRKTAPKGNAIPMLPADEAALAEAGRTFGEKLQGVLAMIKKEKNQTPTAEETMMIGLRTEVFREDWAGAVRFENSRRAAFAEAARGSRILLGMGRQGHLATVLRNLTAADIALSESFLLPHQHMVERRTGAVPGTAGGGAPFLDYSRTLAGLFPALIAFRQALENE
jgi:tryptophan 2,3-dioxygenase